MNVGCAACLVGACVASCVYHPRSMDRFAKVAIVGAIGAVVDFVVLNIMVVFEKLGLGVGWGPSVDPPTFRGGRQCHIIPWPC